MKRVMLINLVVGLWLIVSPVVLAYTAAGIGAINDTVLGAILVASSWWILVGKPREIGADWLQVLCGVWLIIAPFVLRPPELSAATINSVVMGIVVLVVSALDTWTVMHPHARPA